MKDFFISIVFVVLIFAAVGMFVAGQAFSPDRVQVLPARFEGDGAFTVGCQLWDPPFVQGYDDQNKNEGFFVLSVDKNELLAIVDGPQGTTMVTGKNCGLSIDWSTFPAEPRPIPQSRAEGN